LSRLFCCWLHSHIFFCYWSGDLYSRFADSNPTHYRGLTCLGGHIR